MKLSVVLAVRNEEVNLAACLESVKDIASEIVIVDEYSTDNTVSIAKKFGARIYEEPHHEIFHITKQKALDLAKGEWILQLDADEVVTRELAEEIVEVINKDDLTSSRLRGAKENSKKWNLFMRHQKLIEKRDGFIGKKTGDV